MGTCYSKSGQDINSGRTNRPGGRKKSIQKNGHAGPIANRLGINVPIQKDLSDTVYTEDSHIVTTDKANCINKSQQTSLDRLTRDSNKNIESLTDCGILEQNDCVVISERNAKLADDSSEVAQEVVQKSSKHLHLRSGNVSTSDSGIVLEICKCCEQAEVSKDTKDEYSEDFDIQINSLENETDPVACSTNTTDLVPYQCFCTKNCNSHGHRLVTDYSNTCSCHESDNRQSIPSIDRLSVSNTRTESTTDLDKIRLAACQNSLGTPTEQCRCFLDECDVSYDHPSVVQQPEVTTATMNGRDVVVIDAELFSQIIDEIQNLKMKLSQLTEVIQDTEDEDREERSMTTSILSSS